MRTLAIRFLTAAVGTLALCGSAAAGQVYVNVGSPINSFSPPTAGVLKQGDFVIWTWLGSGHTVTQGTSGTGLGGIFNSDPNGLSAHNIGAVFAWKSDQTGAIPYYCRPHFPGMTGTLVIPFAAQAEADFRITEVRYNGGAQNFVEIANLGDAAGDLNQFRLSINGTGPLTPWVASTNVPVGGRVTVSNPAGLSDQGSVALYVPFLTGSIPGTAALTDATMMVDYVEWGTSGGQALEATADATTLPKVWTAGEFAGQVAPGHVIGFCGARNFYGASFWKPLANPTPGATNDCVTPTFPTTWGRIKTLYR